MNRRLRSKLPVVQKQLKPNVISQKTVHEKLTKKQQKQKFFYDKRSKILSKFNPGDTIRVQNDKNGNEEELLKMLLHQDFIKFKRKGEDIGEMGNIL